MEILFYMYVLVVLLFAVLVVLYRVGASSLRSELRLVSPEIEGLVFPKNSQPRFSYYSAIPLKVLFRPESISPPLPPAAMNKLLCLSRTAAAAAIIGLVSFVLLVAQLVDAQVQAP